MENNVVQRNSKVLSEINAEYSSRVENQQNDQLNTMTRKTDNQIETSYKKLSRSCEKLPPLIRKNSNDGLFLSHSMSSKTLTDHLCPAENKSSKTFQTIDMKIKEGNLKQDETKDTGRKTDSNTPEIINNDGLPSLFPNIPPFSSFDFSKTGFYYRGSSEFARESFAQKPGILHLSIEKPDTRSIIDHRHPLIASSKDEISTQEGKPDVPKPCQSGLNASQSFNNQCSYLRSTSSLAFSYHSSSGSSFSSSLSQSLSSPHESYLSQSLNSGQQREKQLKKNTQNFKISLSHEDISQISCLSQLHEDQYKMIQPHSLEMSPPSCNADINRHSGTKNLLPGALGNCQEESNSRNKESNSCLGKEASSEVLVSEKETVSAESTRNSETEKLESVAKKNLCDKSALTKSEQIEHFSRNISCVNSQNKTPSSAKVTSKPQKMYRSTTVAKIENLSSRNETQRQILLNLQRRPNYQKSVSSLRPKDVGVCISSVTMHKRNERNATKHLQNKGYLFENKLNESRKPLVSELAKQHKVRMAPNGENKPLLDILAQRTQTAAVTKLDSCVKIEDMFKKLRERKNEPHPNNNRTVNKQNTVVEPKRILQNISGPKPLGGKLHHPNEEQESKKVNKHPNRKWSNEKDSKSNKMSRKHQSKSKRKNPKQLPARSESKEDLHSKLNPNMTIISGSNWHIVTDCFDVSNVKVVNHSNICQEYTSSIKDDDDPDSSKQNETNKMIDDFHPAFLSNLINNQEKGKKLSHLTIHNLNIQNSNSSYEKLSSVDESPEILKIDDISRNTDWNNKTIGSLNGANTELLNVLSENLSVQDNEHICKDFNKGLPQSEYIAKKVNPVVVDNDSEYETDFECLSECESDCAEDVESLSEKIFAENQQKDQIKTAEVNQENLDSVVEELLNYSTSPVCLEKRLSNISLPESDSILLRSLKHQKNSPFYAQRKHDNTTAAEEEIITDVKENIDVSGAKTSVHRNLKSQAPQKFHCVDGHSSDKESASLSQLEELNNKHDILSRRDSTSTTSSFLSIGEDFSWKKGDLLGSGSYGKVWRGLTSDGEQIAVKQIVLDVSDREKAEREYQKVQEEVEILKTLQHKNIVSFLGMRREGEEVSIFMQYVTGGSIAQLLARFGPLDEPVFCSYTQQILEGVKYLHDKNVIHRDIKGGNVMLMPNSTIKLVDFGCAKRLCYSLNKNSLCNPTSLQGTPYWMAPEVIQETGHGKKSDIWSIGCTVFEMATKNPPWSDMNPYAAIFAICSSKPVPALPSEFSQKARDFVRVCLIRDPVKRPTTSELLQDKFITTPHHGRRRKSVTCFN